MYNIAKKYLLLGLSLSLLIVVAVFFFNQKETTAPQIEIAAKKQTKLTHIKYEGAVVVAEELYNIDDIIVELDAIQTAGTFSLTAMAQSITEEALKAFSDTDEYSLPLLSHWNVGIPELTDAMNPMYMIGRIEQGEHILVSWKLDPYYADTIGSSYYEESIKKAAELQLPLVFILPAPESALTKDSYYKNLSIEDNPNVIDENNNTLDKLSPFGPDERWNEVGNQWSSTTLMNQLQEWYPNPPLVVFISEDEAAKLSWNEVSIASRYWECYSECSPEMQDDNYKRILLGGKWIEKYRQMQNGFKEGFTESAWKDNVKFISYNKLSDNLGKSADWIDNATVTNQYINLWPLTADGATINFDLTGTKSDTTANSPHILANNLPFMLKEAKSENQNPNFAYQLSIDDDSKITDITQYRGLTQFALWFLRPNFIRQKSSGTIRTELEPMFKEVVDSVELIHYNPQVAEFWKNGELVQNGDSYLNENIPEQYQNDPRWFLLDTDQNEPKPWSDDTNIKVWTFAIVKGEAPNREWLIYAQSPENEMSNVTVIIPEYGDVVVDSKVNGSFYVLSENENATTVVASTSTTSSDSTENITSQYLEEVNIPTYDSGDPTHVVVTTANYTTIFNDVSKQHFYVDAGDYPIKVTLTKSGTAEARKTICLNDGLSIHPAKLADGEQASMALVFDGANYWTVDRISNIDMTTTAFSIKFKNGASYNILNNLHIKNYYYGILIDSWCHYNTVQNSYLNHMSHEGRLSDNVGWAVNTTGNGVRAYGNKLINCDIRNSGDGVQLVRDGSDHTTQPDLAFDGTIIDSNRIWMDGDVYTNGDYGTSGVYDADGEYQIGENAMDFKCGSNDSENPVIITNNKMWGYREGDASIVGSEQSGGPGAAVVVHFGVQNVVFEHNIIFDSQVGMATSSLTEGISYSASNWSIKHNIFANLNLVNPENRLLRLNMFYDANNMTIDENIFYNCVKNSTQSGDYGFLWMYNNDNPTMSFSNNVAINAQGTSKYYQAGMKLENNYWYNSEQLLYYKSPEYIPNIFTTAEEAMMMPLEIQIQSLSEVRYLELPSVKTTIDSAHWNVQD